MSRELFQGLLSRYQISFPEDQEILRRIKKFVSENDLCFERSLVVGHVTGSSWIIDSTQSYALLTHHRKLDKWFQLGGHADGDPDIYAVSLREAQEESGLQEITPVSKEIFDIDIHSVPDKNGVHDHYDVRFLFQADRSQKLTVSHESKDLMWIPFDDLEHFVTEPSVLRMHKKVLHIASAHKTVEKESL